MKRPANLALLIATTATWLGLVLALAAWLYGLGVPAWLWVLAMAPMLVSAPGIVGRWHNADGIAMLLCIVYAVIGTMDVASSRAPLSAATAILAFSLGLFFLLIPVVRAGRRRGTRAA